MVITLNPFAQKKLVNTTVKWRSVLLIELLLKIFPDYYTCTFSIVYLFYTLYCAYLYIIIVSVNVKTSYTSLMKIEIELCRKIFLSNEYFAIYDTTMNIKDFKCHFLIEIHQESA